MLLIHRPTHLHRWTQSANSTKKIRSNKRSLPSHHIYLTNNAAYQHIMYLAGNRWPR